MELKYYLEKAEQEGWAIGQFNFSDSKTLEAIVQAACALKALVIIGTSEGASKSVGLAQAVVLVKAYQAETGLPLFLNLDHGKSFGYIKKAIGAGYDAVHFDGSKLKLEQNIRETKKIVAYARTLGILVEGEVGEIGGVLTEPQDALKFVQETQVDSLAVAVGSIHGLRSSLDLKKLRAIKEKIGEVPLVLHGGSGVPEADVKKAIKSGVAKINISTALKIARSSQSIKFIVEDKIKLFGSAHKA